MKLFSMRIIRFKWWITDLLDFRKVKSLLDRVRIGDIDYIKTVDQKIVLKARDENGNSALLIATKEGNLNLCKEILKKCPSILYWGNYVDETVLHQAIDTSSSEIFWFVDFFVSVGVDELEKRSNEGDIYMKFMRWMKMQNFRGDTALVIAARRGYLHVVKRFVEVDRQYNLGLSKVVGDEGKTALNRAVGYKDHEMVKLLSDEEDPYSEFVPYSTAMDLFSCIRKRDLDYMKTVELNVLLNSRDQNRMSALCIATKYNQLDCCKQILKRCPSLLYHQNNDKWSVLHQAADQKNYKLIDFYVSAGLEAAKCEGGADRFKKWINLQNSHDHDTALILAVIHGSRDIVKRFAEVDSQYKLGLSKIVGSKKRTALQWARHYKDHKMIKMLTGNGDQNCSGAGGARDSNIFTFAEVSKHTNLKGCWLLINDKVYDVTNFLRDHPGGSEVLLKASGKDATTDFKKAHGQSSSVVEMMDKFYVGGCDSITSLLSQLANDKPQLYSRVQLKEFTKDFSQPLGSSGFGDVYKGRFPNGVFIAVKVLRNSEHKDKEKMKVMEDQFKAEVDTMGRAYHRNLIKLYGYCYEPNTKFKALVYDYMENGSFEKILFEKKLDLPWEQLHNIAKEIAQEISYLHESCFPQIIHQDIKPANVLLDSTFLNSFSFDEWYDF